MAAGSSDGAAALRALARLWRVRLTRARLHRLAAAMGADVPYFLEGGTALGRDRGDRLSRLADRPRAWVVVVVPRFGVSTREAFGWWDEHAAGRGRAGRAGCTPPCRTICSRSWPGAIPSCPALVAALERAGAFQASLSGSGSAVFGLFGGESQAERAARRAPPPDPRRLVLVTRTLTRRECAGSLPPSKPIV